MKNFFKTTAGAAVGGFLAVALFIALIGAVSQTSWGANNILNLYNSIVVRSGTEIESGTNGYLTVYHPNGTNFARLGTNGAWSFYTPTRTLSGFTGSIIHSNGALGAVFTNTYVGGIFTGTNGGAPAW